MVLALAFGLIFTLGCSLTQAVAGPSKTKNFEKGQSVLSMGTSCFQCPGGENADRSSFEEAVLCKQQINHGGIPQGTELVIVANEYDEYAKFGYLRVTVKVRDHNKVCWVSGEEVVIKP